MANVTHLPTVAEGERTLALPSNASTEETLAAFKDGLQQAVRHMDDVTLEIDGSPGRLRLRFRAYKHRR